MNGAVLFVALAVIAAVAGMASAYHSVGALQ
jgi:hypothetical protein